jgi:hypothetical protein
MNLTDEQHDLLRAVVALYEAGDTSQFIVNRTLSSGSSLIYSGGHPPVPISADDSDFKQLEHERLVTLHRYSGGDHREQCCACWKAKKTEKS